MYSQCVMNWVLFGATTHGYKHRLSSWLMNTATDWPWKTELIQNNSPVLFTQWCLRMWYSIHIVMWSDKQWQNWNTACEDCDYLLFPEIYFVYLYDCLSITIDFTCILGYTVYYLFIQLSNPFIASLKDFANHSLFTAEIRVASAAASRVVSLHTFALRLVRPSVAPYGEENR